MIGQILHAAAYNLAKKESHKLCYRQVSSLAPRPSPSIMFSNGNIKGTSNATAEGLGQRAHLRFEQYGLPR